MKKYHLHIIILGFISFFGGLFIYSFSPTPVVHSLQNHYSFMPFLPQSLIPSPTPTGEPVPNWLNYFNYLRSIGNLPPTLEDISWSKGCWLHARYMVKNGVIMHDEEFTNPWYTVEGDIAASASNLMVSSNFSTPDEVVFELWMTGPFHGIGLIDPSLVNTGYGSYREVINDPDHPWEMGACLNILDGLEDSKSLYPILWPASEQIIPYTAYNGGEEPDPLASCPEYTTPSGPPIYLQIGPGNLVPNVTAHTLMNQGVSVEHCIYDETNYANPDPTLQALGRSILGTRDAIIVIPRNNLDLNETYSVFITSNGITYSWDFHTLTSIFQQPIMVESLIR